MRKENLEKTGKNPFGDQTEEKEERRKKFEKDRKTKSERKMTKLPKSPKQRNDEPVEPAELTGKLVDNLGTTAGESEAEPEIKGFVDSKKSKGNGNNLGNLPGISSILDEIAKEVNEKAVVGEGDKTKNSQEENPIGLTQETEKKAEKPEAILPKIELIETETGQRLLIGDDKAVEIPFKILKLEKGEAIEIASTLHKIEEDIGGQDGGFGRNFKREIWNKIRNGEFTKEFLLRAISQRVGAAIFILPERLERVRDEKKRQSLIRLIAQRYPKEIDIILDIINEIDNPPVEKTKAIITSETPKDQSKKKEEKLEMSAPAPQAEKRKEQKPQRGLGELEELEANILKKLSEIEEQLDGARQKIEEELYWEIIKSSEYAGEEDDPEVQQIARLRAKRLARKAIEELRKKIGQ